MRYFSCAEYGLNVDGDILTMSEEEIRETYYPYWYERMCAKFGKDHVDQTYSFEDCLDDWIITNWAWEVKDE